MEPASEKIYAATVRLPYPAEAIPQLEPHAAAFLHSFTVPRSLLHSFTYLLLHSFTVPFSLMHFFTVPYSTPRRLPLSRLAGLEDGLDHAHVLDRVFQGHGHFSVL